MPLTPAEKQRAYRARQAEKLAALKAIAAGHVTKQDASNVTQACAGGAKVTLLAAPCIVDIDYDEDDHDGEKPIITLSVVARIAVADAVLKSPEEAWAEAQAGHVTINGETLAVPVEDACYFLSIVFKGTQIADLAEKMRMALWVERMAEESRLQVEQARLERKATRKPRAAAK